MNLANTTTTIAAALILGAACVAQVNAQSSGGQYRIRPVVIAAGGGPIAGGNYQITGTFGQAATATLIANSYVIFSGFWSPVGGVLGNFVFANSFE